MFKWIKNFFSKAVATFKDFFDQAFPIVKQEFLGAVSKIALKSVMELDSAETLSNDEKRKAAFKAIEDYAKQQGMEYKDHMIELAIQMAVSALRKI